MIIVTGGAGFIGSNLLKALEQRDELVVVDWLGEDDKWRIIAKRELYDVVRPD
ncbi:MAG: NAD-dependent epimerase/dehydratase family protein, partial [Planctomycetota bacterium]|nr:NAD-dependent epimerase/dehydratase family protein [Planctomycetota bacterium]